MGCWLRQHDNNNNHDGNLCHFIIVIRRSDEMKMGKVYGNIFVCIHHRRRWFHFRTHRRGWMPYCIFLGYAFERNFQFKRRWLALRDGVNSMGWAPWKGRARKLPACWWFNNFWLRHTQWYCHFWVFFCSFRLSERRRLGNFVCLKSKSCEKKTNWSGF